MTTWALTQTIDEVSKGGGVIVTQATDVVDKCGYKLHAFISGSAFPRPEEEIRIPNVLSSDP